MVHDRIRADESQENIRQLKPLSNAPRRSTTSSSSRTSRRRSEPDNLQRGSGDDSKNYLRRSRTADSWKSSPQRTSGPTTTFVENTAQEDFTPPQKRSRHASHGKAHVYTTPSQSSLSFRGEQIAEDFYSASRASHSFRGEEKKDEGANYPYSPSRSSRSFLEEQQTAQRPGDGNWRNNETTLKKQARAKRETNGSGIPTESNNKRMRHKKKEPANAHSTENAWKNFPTGWLLSGMTVALIVSGIVIYFVATKWSEESSIVPTAVLEETPSPSMQTAQNPSAFPPLNFAPSSSPTMTFLFDPPLPEDCSRVKNGGLVLGQDLLTERNFDLILDVTMNIQVEQTEAMELLELEMQKNVMPKLVGCSESPNRKLRHHRILNNPNRYVVGNGEVKWRISSLEENPDCFYIYRRCLGATFNMNLFLKTADVQHFVVVNLIEYIFGGDLVDLFQIESSPFVSVVVRSVINQNPTLAPTREPTVLPTPKPTLPPTVAPTPSPTTTQPSITIQPSFAPTLYPTPRPTTSATMVPSNSPTGGKDSSGYFQQLDRPIRVSCAGDSLTRGRSGGNPAAFSYPSQLRQMLGENFEVHNFGRNAVTAIRGHSLSYVDMTQFQSSLDVEPDIYLLMLGTNDSRYWQEQAHKFRGDMGFIVNQVRGVSPESPPRIIVAIPPWVKTDVYGIRNDILANNVQPEIRALARQENLQLVNMYDVSYNQADHFVSDGLHLNQKGYGTLAANWKVAIECNQNGICEVGENCSTCPGDCYLNCPR